MNYQKLAKKKKYCKCNHTWLQDNKWLEPDNYLNLLEERECPKCGYFYWWLTDKQKVKWDAKLAKEVTNVS